MSDSHETVGAVKPSAPYAEASRQVRVLATISVRGIYSSVNLENIPHPSFSQIGKIFILFFKRGKNKSFVFRFTLRISEIRHEKA